MKTMRLICVMVLFAIVTLPSCKKEAEKSRLTVYLTDGPAEYDSVYIEVAGLQVKASDDPGEGGWQNMQLSSTPATYDLLKLSNGVDTLLSSVQLPAGRVSQLRLILSDNSKVVINGVSTPMPLVVPSGQESGLKLNIHADLVGGVEYSLWIDFDAAQSVVEKGNGDHILKPVIRTFTEATSGAIKGIVLPTAADAVVKATNGTDTLAAIPDPVTGQFLIRGVGAGIWTVFIDANNNYIDKTLSNVSVTIGRVTDIGAVTLTQ